jgi:DNA processing protein
MDAIALERGKPGYPPRLSGEEAPDLLWLSGSWRPAPRAVAVVGARAATRRGVELAHEVGRTLGAHGIDVISGGALGIDAAAHEGALAAGGQTVAVLGTGIDVVYPDRHADLFSRIRAAGGLLTQFAPGQSPRKQHFPSRNKVIAQLAELVVVIEASDRSGSLHTARAARALGRKIAAVPGSPGCDLLVAEGAQAVLSADDVLALVEGRPLAPPTPETEEARRLYAALDGQPRDLGDLAFRADLPILSLGQAILELEQAGLCARAAGGRYVRVR